MNHEEQPTKVPAKDRPEGEAPQPSYGAEREVWTDAMLITLHEGRVRGNKWFSLIDKVASERTLAIAWEKVATNAGACGVDSVTISHFAKDSERRLLAVKKHLKEGDYQPQAIKRVHIPKAGSNETRPLGIPTVRDRVAQGALKMVIEPIFEREFCENSYGFRPGRGCKDALREVERLLHSGHNHVVDLDIQGYFDAIPHGRLLELVSERISDRKVLGLIAAFLKQGVMEEGIKIANEAKQGSPQGGLISPLLANIYLNPLDWLLESLGLQSIRYADDIVVLAESPQAAQRALETISDWMGKASLTLHPEKTRLVDMTAKGAYFDFLGYRFVRSQRGKLNKVIRPKSEKKLRSSLKKATKRCNRNCLPSIIAELNPKLRGFYGYFKHAHPRSLERMDGWVRMRLRSLLRKRHKGKGRGRGLDHRKWPNRYFAKLGLYSLAQAREEEMSLRKRATC